MTDGGGLRDTARAGFDSADDVHYAAGHCLASALCDCATHAPVCRMIPKPSELLH